uniref:R-spondin Fu-CRD domain-containing protein n=1 Tax=Oreochromis aureus TaxID=47969 RepID=A0A668T5J3_OREAU
MLLTKLNFKNQTDYVASYWPAGCKLDCASCFSENFCLRCHPGNFLSRHVLHKLVCPCQKICSFENLCPSVSECVRANVCRSCRVDLFFHHGHCHLTCPQGFEPDVQLMWCTPQSYSFPFLRRVQCRGHVYSQCWGMDRLGCMCSETEHADPPRGQRTRTRPVLHFPSVYGNPCSHLSEIRKCAIRKRLRSSLSKWQRRNKMFNAYKRYTSAVDSLNTSRFSTH